MASQLKSSFEEAKAIRIFLHSSRDSMYWLGWTVIRNKWAEDRINFVRQSAIRYDTLPALDMGIADARGWIKDQDSSQ